MNEQEGKPVMRTSPSLLRDDLPNKRVLYVGPTRAHFDDLVRGMAHAVGCTPHVGEDENSVACRNVRMCLARAPDVETASRMIHRGYYNLVVLDARGGEGPDGLVDGDMAQSLRMLDVLESPPDAETRYGFHRVMALVSGLYDDRVDQRIAAFGARGIGRVIRDASAGPRLDGAASGPRAGAFFRLVADEAMRMMTGCRRGKRALCASGGGITGIYFEMGVLKCLSDCLSPGLAECFDMYFGISAGAVVTGFLANGYTIDESMGALAGVRGLRIPPTNLAMFRPNHVDASGLAQRFLDVMREAGNVAKSALRGRRKLTLDTLMIQFSDLLGPPFHGRGYEEMLRRAFSSPGSTNDFRQLPRPLYIGASDQDLRTPVLFGDEGLDDVPISQAVQASLSINPAFSAAQIRGRYYEDGAVTRTSNFRDAVKKGADLIFIIDPFVPYVSRNAGFSHRRGLLYNVDQNVRTMSFTRFEGIRDLALRQHPEVSCFTFLPRNRLRRLMSTNPMDHRPYLPIWKGAYLSTLDRLQDLRYRISGDLMAHGVSLDTARAQEVAARLRHATVPTLGDFYPEGRFELTSGEVATVPKRFSPGVHASLVAAHSSAA